MKHGKYEEALRGYLWAFDHGTDNDDTFFFAVRGTKLLDAMVGLSQKYPPAKVALRERCAKLARQMVRASEQRLKVPEEDVVLFVRLAFRIEDERTAFTTYGVVKVRETANAELRRSLWAEIEAHLVEQRRYQEAVADEDAGLAVVRFYLSVLRSAGPEMQIKYPIVRTSIEYVIEHEGAVHFEALLGAGRESSAENFAEELIQFAPTGHTFAVLIKRAARAGSAEVARKLLERAKTVVSGKDRVLVDEAARFLSDCGTVSTKQM